MFSRIHPILLPHYLVRVLTAIVERWELTYHEDAVDTIQFVAVDPKVFVITTPDFNEILVDCNESVSEVDGTSEDFPLDIAGLVLARDAFDVELADGDMLIADDAAEHAEADSEVRIIASTPERARILARARYGSTSIVRVTRASELETTQTVE